MGHFHFDPDKPQELIADIRERLKHNYVVYQAQVQSLLLAFDALEKKHRADLRAIARLEKKLREAQA